MPLLQNQKNSDLPRSKSAGGLQYLNRDQLEYTAQTLFTYGTILFLAIGVATSVTYVFAKQLQK